MELLGTAKFYHDLEKFPLYIKTNAVVGKYNALKVFLFTAQDKYAGSFKIAFKSSQYGLGSCHEDKTRVDFDTELPTDTDKVWKITKTIGSDVRILIQCNDVQVLNATISKSSTCENTLTNFEIKRWRQVVQIMSFAKEDTASKFYWQPFSPGNRARLKP